MDKIIINIGFKQLYAKKQEKGDCPHPRNDCGPEELIWPAAMLLSGGYRPNCCWRHACVNIWSVKPPDMNG